MISSGMFLLINEQWYYYYTSLMKFILQEDWRQLSRHFSEHKVNRNNLFLFDFINAHLMIKSAIIKFMRHVLMYLFNLNFWFSRLYKVFTIISKWNLNTCTQIKRMILNLQIPLIKKLITNQLDTIIKFF